MINDIVIAVLGFVGTLIGTLAGIIASNSLTAYRIKELEKKVDEYNSVSVRVTVLERDNAAQWTKINEMHEDIKAIRKEITGH